MDEFKKLLKLDNDKEKSYEMDLNACFNKIKDGEHKIKEVEQVLINKMNWTDFDKKMSE